MKWTATFWLLMPAKLPALDSMDSAENPLLEQRMAGADVCCQMVVEEFRAKCAELTERIAASFEQACLLSTLVS